MRDLSVLARYLSVFEPAGILAGEPVPAQKAGANVSTMPYATLEREASAFVGALYDSVWILSDFNWGAWSREISAQRLLEDRAALAKASELDLAKLLTAIVRRDRLYEGELLAAFESGLVLAILRRAVVLMAEANGSAQ